MLTNASLNIMMSNACKYEHSDAAERKKWNAFKIKYRRSHPTENRNSKYYLHVRKIYKEQNVPTLSTWIKPSNCDYTDDSLFD